MFHVFTSGSVKERLSKITYVVPLSFFRISSLSFTCRIRLYLSYVKRWNREAHRYAAPSVASLFSFSLYIYKAPYFQADLHSVSFDTSERKGPALLLSKVAAAAAIIIIIIIIIMLWNGAVHTDREVTANRPDIIIKN